jgi:hypothetical protein
VGYLERQRIELGKERERERGERDVGYLERQKLDRDKEERERERGERKRCRLSRLTVFIDPCLCFLCLLYNMCSKRSFI